MSAPPMSGARLPRSRSSPLGLSVDMSPCLRSGECLAKRPGLQARSWTARSARGAT
jgi:hypothetical protein